MSTLKFTLTNLTCDACTKVAQLKLKRIPGIQNIAFERRGSKADGLMESESALTLIDLRSALQDTPYGIEAAL